jgi:hypothetical protein
MATQVTLNSGAVSSAGTLKLQTNGTTDAVHIDASQNVGIGTGSPSVKLDVAGAINVTGNTTLGDASTDTVTVNGYMGVGGAGQSNVAFYLKNTEITGTSQYGLYSELVGNSAATTGIYGVMGSATTAAASFTVNTLAQFRAQTVTKGAGSTITHLMGVQVLDQTQGTNNYGIYSLVSSGTNKWNIYASGTAANYFAGNVLLGTTTARAFGSFGTGALQYETAVGSSLATLISNRNDTGASVFGFGKSRGTTTGSVTAVTSGDPLGTFNWSGADGTSLVSAASVVGAVDGAVSTGIVPARLVFSTSNTSGTLTERMRLDSSGNLGLGVTPSAWGTGSAYRAIDIGSGSALANMASTTTTDLISNAYYNGTNWIYKNTAAASKYRQSAGAHTWSIATSGTAAATVTFTDAMTLDASGNLGLGVTPSAWWSSSKAFQVGAGAQLAFEGLSGAGIIYNNAYRNTSNQEIYTQNAYATKYAMNTGAHQWYTAPSGTAGTAITFTQAMTLDALGNLGIGTTSPASTRMTIVGGALPTADNGDVNALQFAAGVTGRRASSNTVGFIGSYANASSIEISAGQTGSGISIHGQAASANANTVIAYTNSLERMRIDSSGNVLITSSGGLGYGTGSGGAVTQATSRTTGVTLNKTNGAITLVSAAGSTSWQSFTVTNSTVAATDVVHVSQKSGTDLYEIHVTAVAAGSFRISFKTTAGTTTEQPVFNFAVIKAVTA